MWTVTETTGDTSWRVSDTLWCLSMLPVSIAIMFLSREAGPVLAAVVLVCFGIVVLLRWLNQRKRHAARTAFLLWAATAFPITLLQIEWT